MARGRFSLEVEGMGATAIATAMGLLAFEPGQPAAAHVSMTQQEISSAVRAYRIPEGSVAEALTRLADENGVRMIYRTRLTKNFRTAGLTGSYTLTQALDTLLSGTGVGYRVTGEGRGAAIILAQADNRVRSDAGAEALPAIDIGAERPPTSGPGSGKPVLTPQNSYVVPNASLGTKTDTPVMNTPVNVQAVTEKAIEDQQAITLDEALRNVSGVTAIPVATNGSGDRGGFIFVRGFATTDYYRDGFRVSQAGSYDNITTGQLADVQSIEVLKGPAAILYGRSEPGGIINLATRDPQETPHYSINQQIGSLALYRTTVNATGPLTHDKSILYRLDASYENNGAPFKMFVDGTHSQNGFVAPVIKWSLDESTSVKAEFQHNDDTSGYRSLLNPLYNGSFIAIPRNINYNEPGSVRLTQDFAALTLSHKFDEDWSIKQRVAFDHANWALIDNFQGSALSGGNRITRTGNSGDLSKATISINQDVVGHFDTFGARHTLLLGGDYYRTSVSSGGSNGWRASVVNLADPIHPGIPASPSSTLFNAAAYSRQDTAGLYVQDQLELPYSFFVMAGARYQKIYQSSLSAFWIGLPLAGTIRTLSASPMQQNALPLNESKVTPRFGLLWRPQPWVSLYGNYTEGFSPNASGIVYPNIPAPPTSAVSWEAGAKFELFDGALRATADYYELVKTNITITDPDSTHICAGGSCSLVVGEARSQGPELDIQGTLLPGWNVIVNYTNQDVRVTKGTSTVGGQSGTQPGQRFPQVPRNLASLWSTYEFQDGTFKGLKLGAGYTYHGSQPVYDQSGGKGGAVPLLASWGTVDLMAAYTFDVDGLKTKAQLNITNLFDRTYYTAASTSYTGGTGFSASAYRAYGPPFTVRGSFGVEF